MRHHWIWHHTQRNVWLIVIHRLLVNPVSFAMVFSQLLASRIISDTWNKTFYHENTKNKLSGILLATDTKYHRRRPVEVTTGSITIEIYVWNELINLSIVIFSTAMNSWHSVSYFPNVLTKKTLHSLTLTVGYVVSILSSSFDRCFTVCVWNKLVWTALYISCIYIYIYI